MKNIIYFFAAALLIFSCKDDEKLIFDKTADERAAEAIASLKQDLIAPANGWKIKYRPQEGAGAYYVLLDFDENDKVTIRTDLGADDGEYFEQTISYRVDNSMGLELIFENYSFFSFLFELDQATFGAEYEFDFVNKTPDNDLVFRSKTDVSTADIVVFEEASAADANLPGPTLAANLNILSQDLDKFSSSLLLTYDNKDLALYLSLDELRRTLTVTAASLKSNPQNAQAINFNTAYVIQGDSIVFDEPLQRTVLGNAIKIRSLKLNTIGQSQLNLCATPMTLHSYTGVTSANDPFVLESTLADLMGASFPQVSDFFFSPLAYIFDNGQSVSTRILQDVAGALEMHMYYGYDLGGGDVLYAIGFVIQNPDGTVIFALREFTPVLNGNNLVFNFAPEFRFFGDTAGSGSVNTDNINIYLDALSQGDHTYVFQINNGVYEFYNPCSGWSFVFINAN